jgi:HD-like signal output (HDOD) protein
MDSLMESKEALRQLVDEVEHNELVFSTHAHIALQVRMALDDPEIHLEKAAKVVQAEPLLAAKAVALANSVAFKRSGNPISDVRSAVTRLGINLIRDLSTALIMRQISASPSAAHEVLATRLWEHSSHVAALCYVLAKRISHQNPDKAMFAGMVHEIGGFYLISRATAYPGLIDDGVDESWRTGGEALVAATVLRALAVPEDIATAVKALWQGNITMPPRSLADTLFLANCLTPIANPLQGATSDADRTEILALVAQVMADKELASVLEESGEELDTIAASLRF